MHMPNIFDAAVENWLAAGAPIATFQALKFVPGPADKVSPSRVGDCPQAHANYKLGVPETNPEVRDVHDNLRLMLGHITQWRWYNILGHAPGPQGLELQYEVPYETTGVAGHIDILLSWPDELGPHQVPVEIKNTKARLSWRHFWQAVIYARAFGECVLILDRDGGDYDLVDVRLDSAIDSWVAYDLRGGWQFTNRKTAYAITNFEASARLQEITYRVSVPQSLPPYPTPVLKQCIFQNGNWKPCPWFNLCWGTYKVVSHTTPDQPVVITDRGVLPITEA